MAAGAIPNEYLDLFEKRAFGHLATLMPDGSPQVTPVWIGHHGTYVLVNSAKGCQKDRNGRRDERVAISIQDSNDPYRYLQIRGRVAKIAEEDAEAGIDRLANKVSGCG